MKQLKKNGFTLIESLLSLLITSIVSMLCMIILQTCIQMVSIDFQHQNQMAILQLRQKCALASNVHVENGNLYMIDQRKDIEISYHNHRLVQQDGYVIWMEDLDYAFFIQEDNDIYLEWSSHEKEMRSQIL
ncbi:prepilin-type N-terminal cleavage/methylation domain-containing protein [Floccifex sp.]|uniref:prepilin-type N-terminal cleavage/methylation domain-containing protein n=1 Tax=Floccifex sp. TaxID=2815810 RepID=UPI003EFF79A3